MLIETLVFLLLTSIFSSHVPWKNAWIWNGWICQTCHSKRFRKCEESPMFGYKLHKLRKYENTQISNSLVWYELWNIYKTKVCRYKRGMFYTHLFVWHYAHMVTAWAELHCQYREYNATAHIRCFRLKMSRVVSSVLSMYSIEIAGRHTSLRGTEMKR